jgi:hypothetical protein
MSTTHVRTSVVVPVTIRNFGQFITINPPVKDLDRYLYTVLHGRGHDPEHGSAILAAREPLIWPGNWAGQRVLQAPAGLRPVVIELLERLGVPVQAVGPETPKLPAPDLSRLAGFPQIDVPLLNFVRHLDRGLVRVGRHGKVRVARLLAQIALAWPELPIVIVSASVDLAHRVYRGLRQYLSDVGLAVRNCLTPRQTRVVVTTPMRLGRGEIEIEQRQILIALNPDKLVSSSSTMWGTEILKHVWKGRLLGVLFDDQSFPPRTRDLITAYFGTTATTVPAHGRRLTHVNVVMSEICGGYRPPHSRDEAVLKQLGIYGHHLRNRRIVHLARDLAVARRKELEEKFTAVAVRTDERRLRVGVLVDQVEHGLILARKLGWPLVAGSDVEMAGLTDEDRDILERGRAAQSKRKSVVITFAGLEGVRRFDVLVRADGGVGLPPLPGRWLSVPHAKPASLTIVDFKDNQHPMLRKRSRLRKEAYRAADWCVAGDAWESPLDSFLRTRPEVDG